MPPGGTRDGPAARPLAARPPLPYPDLFGQYLGREARRYVTGRNVARAAQSQGTTLVVQLVDAAQISVERSGLKRYVVSKG